MPLQSLAGDLPITLRHTLFATNRTGATLAKGDVGALDLTGSDGDVDAYGTDQLDPFANVIAVGADHDDGWPVVVCLETTLADNVIGEFGLIGVFDVECAGSSNVTAGVRLNPTSGQTYLTAEADGLAVCGIALTAGSTTTTLTTAKVLFNGWACAFGAQAEV